VPGHPHNPIVPIDDERRVVAIAARDLAIDE